MSDRQLTADLEWVAAHDHELLCALLDVSGLLVVVVDLQGCIALFNRACEQCTGYSAQEVLGRDLFSFLIPDDELAGTREIARALSTDGTPNEYTNHWLTRSGERRAIQWRNTVLRDVDGRPRLLVATGIDLTNQRRTERALSHSDAQVRLLVDALPGLVSKIDCDYRVQFANWAYRHWFGLDPAAQTGRHVRDLIGYRAFDLLRPHFDRALGGRASTYHGMVPYARGGTRFVHGNYIPSYDDEGTVDGLYVLALDLSEQQNLRRQLDSETRRARTVMHHAIDGIVIINARGIIQGFNPAAERMFGYDAAAVVGRNVSMLMPEPERSRHDRFIDRYLRTGRGAIIGSGREVTGMRRDGTLVDLRLSIAEFVEDGQRYFVGFTSDISDRRRAERRAQARLRELAHMDRRAAMSELTAGLAHELSQPLTAIRTTAEACLALEDTADGLPAPLRQALTRISTQAERAGEILQQVRAYLAKGQPGATSNHAPGTMLEHVLMLLAQEIESSGVRLEVHTQDTPRPCRVNQIQVEQVLFNLIRNALEAMARGQGPRLLQVSCRHDAQADVCVITVADSGPGIAEEHLEWIFEPFFTTRPEGLGQGLSICRSIIEEHEGRLTAENRPEGGALFRVTLPLSEEGDTDHDRA